MLLQNRSVAALTAAEVVSTTGTEISALALPWFVLITTGSASRMSLVVAAEFAGIALFGIPAGSVATRLGPRRSMLACDLVRAPLIASIPLLYARGWLSFPILLAVVFVVGALFTPHSVSSKVILPQLLGEDEAVVARASSMLGAASEATLVLGPASAGFLIALLRPANVLYVDAATYLVSFLLVLLMVPGRRVASSAEEHPGLLAGLRFIVRDRLLGPMVASGAILVMAWTGLVVAGPVLAFRRFGANPRVAGWLLAAWGAGGVAGGLASMRALKRMSPARLMVLSAAPISLPLWALVLPLPVWAAAMAFFGYGLCNAMVFNPMFALLTMRPPVGLRAKALSASETLLSLSGPVGMLVAGQILQHTMSLGIAFAVIAAVATSGSVVFVTFAARASRDPVGVEPMAAEAQGSG